MSRALDHVVIAARNLDAEAEKWRSLGFRVGARNRHSWGTENHIIQFDGAFLELIGLGEGFTPPPPDDPVFPFAGFLQDFLRTREGIAMLAMRSRDAEADRQAFAGQGIGYGPRFDFGRKGQRDGREVEVAFSLAFARSQAVAEAGFFVCQHHFPQNFWSPAAQVHPNGATGVASLTLQHPAPDRAHGFLAAFLDAEGEATPEGWRFDADGTRIDCVRTDGPACFARMTLAAPAPITIG